MKKAFDAVIGYGEIKRELMQIADVLANGEAYGKLGVSAPRGLLLYGEPGVGKTLMATALVKASGRRVFLCRKDKPNGDFVKAIKKTFADAAAVAPSIVFLDDMDKFANGDDSHPDAEEYVTVQSCIDEIRGKEVFVLATANNTRALPHSLLRAGRFDRRIEVEAPCGEDAVEIIAHYIGKKKCVGEMDPVTVARIMAGRSCAELETVINEAGLQAGFDRSEVITMDHFMKACLHTVHGVPYEALCKPLKPVDLTDGTSWMARVIWHEAGHATVSETLEPGSVTLITAYGKNGSRVGFTSYHREEREDDPLQFKYTLICKSLAGMAAVEQQLGCQDVGSADDLNKAFRIASDMITDDCVSGLSLHDSPYRSSEALLAAQEQAAAALVERIYCKTKEILARNRALWEALARELSRKGVLTAADVVRIRQTCPVTSVSL